MLDLEHKVLLLLVAGISLLFGLILWPFAGAILWAVVLAILFSPLNQRLLAFMPKRRNTSALLSVIIIVVMVIVPIALMTSLLVQEVAGVYAAFQSGELSISQVLQHARDALPGWANTLQVSLGIPSLATLPDRLGTLMMETGRFLAGQAINLGQNTVHVAIGFFILLYLLHFLLRDGHVLLRRIDDAIPLRAEYKSELAGQFALAIRVIVKGSLAVAVVQGALGALIFWLLGIRAPLVWGACMAVLSLLPVGTGLVWVPVAAYFIVSGSVWRGMLLLAFGVLVIDMAANVLRPILVGKRAQIPDYLVLITTVGGISVFGINGFVIGPVIASLFLAVWHVLAVSRVDKSGPLNG
jgi:predicted PurR-regulated permease PerM